MENVFCILYNIKISKKQLALKLIFTHQQKKSNKIILDVSYDHGRCNSEREAGVI